jgi:DNA (cytosine-5)-methyltransferase 1
MQLVLSLFPGIGLLDMAFEAEGFCVVQSRDWIFGGDLRERHFPPGVFCGVIGGPPCQAFSVLAHMVRHNGHAPQFGNLIPEFERVIRETVPRWFLMEEVPAAPRPQIDGYANHEFTLNNRQCVDEAGEPAVQNRVRAITFGHRGERRVLLLETVAMMNRRFEYAVCGGTHGDGGISREHRTRDPRTAARKAGVPIKIGGSGKEKASVRRLNSCIGGNIKSRSSLAGLCELQGLPADFMERMPFTVSAACKAIGNGVPLPMGRALARAVKEATENSVTSVSPW